MVCLPGPRFSKFMRDSERHDHPLKPDDWQAHREDHHLSLNSCGALARVLDPANTDWLDALREQFQNHSTYKYNGEYDRIFFRNVESSNFDLSFAWKRDITTHEIIGADEGIDPKRKTSEKETMILGDDVLEDARLLGERPLVIAPGFDRGLPWTNDDSLTIDDKKQILSMTSLMTAFHEITNIEPVESSSIQAEPDLSPTLHQEIDAMIPVSDNVHSIISRRPQTTVNVSATYARLVDVNRIPADFTTIVPRYAFPFKFELDPFQKQAVYHLERGESVFVAAHTSAGKTAVAEYAIALAQSHLTKAIYTSPIKALSNQKFRDFRTIFGDDNVGLLTGDVQVNSDTASCLIMTTEILRSMLYRGASLLRDVEFVVFDEVHYVNDVERGVVWEEVIIMLERGVKLILLSATVPNTFEFADWVGRTRKTPIYVISTLTRPIPLEHYLCVGKQMICVMDASKAFKEDAYKTAVELLKKKGRSVGQFAFKNPKQEQGMWSEMTGMLQKKQLLPVVIFTFSKKRCEENADALAYLDLNSASEKSAIHIFLSQSLSRLSGSDGELPQIQRMRELLSRGIAVHHSGLLPLMKEAVEILFGKGLVKALFATETFAMGVNMPARTVVFSSVRKHDGSGFRYLLPGEYTQMAGRAGRRGLDAVGMVLIACGEDLPTEPILRTILLGTPSRLSSQFRLTYNMILNLLRVEAIRVEEMMKQSFSENANQKRLPDEQLRLEENTASLKSVEQLECSICDKDIDKFYNLATEILALGASLFEYLLCESRQASRFFDLGRIIIINTVLHRNKVAVVLKIMGGETKQIPGARSMIQCLTLIPTKQPDKISGTLDLPLPPTIINVPPAKDEMAYDVISIHGHEVLKITQSKLKLDLDTLTDKYHPKDLKIVGTQLEQLVKNVNGSFEELELPNFKYLELDEKRLTRVSLSRKLSSFNCCRCPDLSEHYGLYHRQITLKEQLAELQFKLSDNSLLLLPEYHARIAVLKELGYIDEAGTVQIKGRVACEINTVDELLMTELIFDNFLKDYTPAEVVALLSAMVFQERHASEPHLSSTLQRGREAIESTTTRLLSLQTLFGLESPSYAPRLCFGLVEVVHAWASGVPFKEITELTDVLEGSIVRCVTRLDETCRELRGAAKIIGDTVMFRKMEEASIAIKRDICFASSLYL